MVRDEGAECRLRYFAIPDCRLIFGGENVIKRRQIYPGRICNIYEFAFMDSALFAELGYMRIIFN